MITWTFRVSKLGFLEEQEYSCLLGMDHFQGDKVPLCAHPKIHKYASVIYLESDRTMINHVISYNQQQDNNAFTQQTSIRILNY